MGIYEKEEGLVWKHGGPENESQVSLFGGHWYIGYADKRTQGIESTTAATLQFESSTWRYIHWANHTWVDDDKTLKVRASGPY